MTERLACTLDGTPLSPNIFLLVATDIDAARLSAPSAFAVANRCFELARWGMGHHTRNRLQLQPGDQALIYVGGKREHRQTFVGQATIAGVCEDRGIQIGERQWPCSVPLRGIRPLWPPVSIRPLLSNLSFIRNPASIKWGSVFQSGIVRITEGDLRLISAAAKATPRSRSKAPGASVRPPRCSANR